MVRRIYEGDDAKIDSAFTLYYMAVNVGATASQIATPLIAIAFGWHVAFAVTPPSLFDNVSNGDLNKYFKSEKLVAYEIATGKPRWFGPAGGGGAYGLGGGAMAPGGALATRAPH